MMFNQVHMDRIRFQEALGQSSFFFFFFCGNIIYMQGKGKKIEKEQ